MYCHRHVEEICNKDTKSKREKRVREKVTEEKEKHEEDEEDSDFKPSSSLPPSDPPSPSPSPLLSPHLTNSPYDTDQQLLNDEYSFTCPSNEYKSTPLSGTPFPSDVHDHKQADFDSLHTLCIICEAMVQWMVLGPVKDWTVTFCTKYDQAATGDHGDTQEVIDTFLQGVVEHVKQGKAMLADLGRTGIFRLEKGDRLMAGDMQETLHHGVVILEAHLSLAAPSGPLPSNSLSKICAYEGFADILHVLCCTDTSLFTLHSIILR